jgi:hypothetical protein
MHAYVHAYKHLLIYTHAPICYEFVTVPLFTCVKYMQKCTCVHEHIRHASVSICSSTYTALTDKHSHILTHIYLYVCVSAFKTVRWCYVFPMSRVSKVHATF